MEHIVTLVTVCLYLGALVFTLVHIHRNLVIGFDRPGMYWAAAVLCAGIIGLFLYWTCRSRVESIAIRYYMWCQSLHKKR